MRHVSAAALLLFAMMTAASCGGGHDTPRPAELPPAAPPTPAFQQMLDDVAATRGLPVPTDLRMGFVTREQVPELLDRVLTADDREAFAKKTTVYRLLGHLKRDQDYLAVYRELLSASLVGVYSPHERSLWVVTDSPGPTTPEQLPRKIQTTIAHEMVHAIQDASFPLDPLGKQAEGLDADLALTCLIEGDAVTHADLYTANYLVRPGVAVSIEPSSLTSANASISRALFFPYATGAEWLHLVQSAGGSTAVDGLFAKPPTSTAEILHPDKAAAGWRPEQVTLPDLSSGLGKDWARESGGAFGEFELRNYLQLHLAGIPAATAATGWAGDHYDVYRDRKSSVAVFRIAFANEAEAGEFRAARLEYFKAGSAKPTERDGVTQVELKEGTTAWAAGESGREVLFVIGSSPEVALRALQVLIHG